MLQILQQKINPINTLRAFARERIFLLPRRADGLTLLPLSAASSDFSHDKTPCTNSTTAPAKPPRGGRLRSVARDAGVHGAVDVR
jgi:hypothetical protein